jgi:hypothetical protein
MSDTHRGGESGSGLSWDETFDDVIGSAVDREEEIELRAEGIRVEVPLRTDPDADRAEWRFDGTVRINVDGASGPLAEWLRWWNDRTGSR